MTREEKQKAIDALKISAPVMAVTQEEFNDYIQTLNKIMDWLEQEQMREFTEEEAKAYSRALDKMYKPTGFNVFNNPCDVCRNKQTSFCGNCKEYDEFEQEPCEDAEQIDYHDDFATALKKMQDYEEQQNDKKCGSYNNTNTFKSCSDCKLIGTDSCYMVCGGSKSLYKPKQKLEPCDDAISQILQRMWNCRGKHTTSIDKVKMEQIIRDELPSVTHKSGKWILTIEDWNKWTCSKCGYVKRTDIHVNIGWKYCPNCGADMRGEK